MLQKFVILILGAVFVLVFSFLPKSIMYALLEVLGLAIVSVVANFFFYRNQLRKPADVASLFLPAFWIFSVTAVVFLLPTPFWRFAFIVCCAFILITLELNLKSSNKHFFIENLFFISATGIFLGIWALDYYYTPGWWIIMSLIFVACFILLWMGFSVAVHEARGKLLYSLFLSFLLTQASWAILFWPLHYVTDTLVFSGLFYLLWMLARFFLSGSLGAKKIIFYSVFAGIVEFFALITALWLPRA